MMLEKHTLNSNLILLIHEDGSTRGTGASYFKFQSDSINTYVPKIGDVVMYDL